MSVIYFLLVIAGVTIGLVLRSYLPSYFGEKGKNLATKEDIEEITRKIESIKHDFATALEQSKQKHDMRLAAIDIRLAAHQKAYSLWWDLRSATFKPDEIGKVIWKCQHFWVNNNLYLDTAVREAFYRSYMAAGGHLALTQTTPRTPELIVEIRNNWEVIDKPRELIENAIKLPNIAPEEAATMNPNPLAST